MQDHAANEYAANSRQTLPVGAFILCPMQQPLFRRRVQSERHRTKFDALFALQSLALMQNMF